MICTKLMTKELLKKYLFTLILYFTFVIDINMYNYV